MKVGDKFSSFADVELAVSDLCKKTSSIFYRRDSRKIESARNKIHHPMEPELVYYEIKYACFRGGRDNRRQGKGIRKTLTFQNECPAHISLRMSRDGKYLEVRSLSNEHNHLWKVHKNVLCPGTGKRLKGNNLCTNEGLSSEQLNSGTVEEEAAGEMTEEMASSNLMPAAESIPDTPSSTVPTPKVAAPGNLPVIVDVSSISRTPNTAPVPRRPKMTLKRLSQMAMENEAASERDECASFGEYVASKIRLFSDRRFQLLAQNRISNILFEMEMEQLNPTETTLPSFNRSSSNFRTFPTPSNASAPTLISSDASGLAFIS